MRTSSLLRFYLGLCGASAVTAAPLVQPETWLSPRALSVVERVRTAYAGVEGWSAEMVSETRSIQKGTEVLVTTRATERYLPVAGGMGYYQFVSYLKDGPHYAVVQNREEQYRLARIPGGSLQAVIAAPIEQHRPRLWSMLETDLTNSSYLIYGGQELVAGESCDVLEFITVSKRPAAPNQPPPPPLVVVSRFDVSPAGFVVRQTMAIDGPQVSSSVTRVDHDAKAKLSPEDFTREAFERTAAVILKPDETMPALVPELFRRGERLPDLSFASWPDKKPFRISDLQGKIVVVETWASWCHFCKEAFPFYEKTRKALESQDVVFVAVSFDARPADYEKWMNAHADGYGFKFGLVDSADANAAIKEFRGSLPAFYVLGRDGRILSSYVGYGYGASGEDPRLLAALREAGVKI
jgi:thiol-disulfide isomerase/thioredoxin